MSRLKFLGLTLLFAVVAGGAVLFAPPHVRWHLAAIVGLGWLAVALLADD